MTRGWARVLATGPAWLAMTVAPAPDLMAGAALAAPPPAPRSCHAPDGVAPVPDGEAWVGEDGAAGAGRRVPVAAFDIDRHEVTNRQFARFVQATGYVTEAERQGGGAVFVAPTTAVALDNPARWWRWVKGASWKAPTGEGSAASRQPDDPVVQVTYADAAAFAQWAGRALPSEAQWERAARGLQSEARPQSAWAYDGEGHPTANTFQGPFPVADSGEDGYRGLAPAGCFAANDFGVYDMIGNAWEWTTSAAPDGQGRVVKGGSFLCSFDYCANFRPAGWQAQEMDLPTSHIGFRTTSRA